MNKDEDDIGDAEEMKQLGKSAMYAPVNRSVMRRRMCEQSSKNIDVVWAQAQMSLAEKRLVSAKLVLVAKGARNGRTLTQHGHTLIK